MSRIFFATRNEGKVDYVRNILREFDGVRIVHYPLNIPERQAHSVEDVAKEKARYAFKEINNGRDDKTPCMTLDSGLYIPSLKGFPGTLVRTILDTIEVDGILRLLAGKARECEIRTCVAYWDGNLTDPLVFSARIKGTIADEPKGETKPYHWSNLAEVFIPKGLNKTEAELSEEDYNEWRKRADTCVSSFARWLRDTSED